MYYTLIVVLLFAAELLYFYVANRFNIIDKPNNRSSHSKVVLRGGGVIFSIGALVWAVFAMLGESGVPGLEQFAPGVQLVQGAQFAPVALSDYLPFLVGLLLVAGVSFIDDVHPLPDSVRLVVHFVSMGLLFWSLGILHWNMWWVIIIALIVCVGITNVYNFMDGINGITGGYSLAVLVPLLLAQGEVYGHSEEILQDQLHSSATADSSLIITIIMATLVFCFFNFRPKNKAKCFAGDVGSISMAFIILFVLGKIIVSTQDITWLIFLVVYGIDACFTILHRIMLHENLGKAHRKHAYQLMANELGMSHITVSLLYMGLQLLISLVFIYFIPDSPLAHWIYLVIVLVILSGGYLIFMKRYYHLHEIYLEQMKNK